jgi:hypothetical protein
LRLVSRQLYWPMPFSQLRPSGRVLPTDQVGANKPRQMKPDIEYLLNIARRYLAKQLIFLALPTDK